MTKTVKRILSAALAAMLALLAVSCSKGDGSPMVSMYDLRVSMLGADPSLPEMKSVGSSDEEAEKLFAYLSDADYSKVEGFFLSYAADGTSYEIAVVAAKSEDDVRMIGKSLEDHVKSRVELYKNYSPAQVPRAEAATVTISGRYAALIMCDDAEAVRDAFERGIR